MPRVAAARTLRPFVADLLVIVKGLRNATKRGFRPRPPGPESIRPLRVGVDIRPFYEPLTGVGWYLHHLLEELSRRDVELIFFGDPLVTDDGPHLYVSLPSEGQARCFDFRGRHVSPLARPMARVAFPLLALLERCDLFFGANYFLSRSLSAIALRRVVTVHDLTFKRFPHMLQAETLENLATEMQRELFRCDAAISVSEATRTDLLTYFEIDEKKTFVVHSGLAPLPTAGEVVDLPEDFLLFVGTIEPRKNLEILVDAFETLRSSASYQGDLVIVGKVGWKSEAILERISRSPWRSSIHHLDYLRREQLTTVYRRCRVFVLPSHYEGFGFPLLEAMSENAPSIAARSSSLPEIGGQAALFFEPGNVHDLIEKISLILSDHDLRRDLIEKGRAQAGRFRWQDTAEKTLSIFRSAAR